MKLKKQVKVVIVFILLGGIGFGFYSFNHWFFAKYKTKDVDVEEKINGNSKEIRLEKESTEEDAPIRQDSLNTSNTNKKRIRASEIYYCSEGDTLDGKECITEIEVNALKVQAEDNRDYYEVIFSFDTLASSYQISVAEAKSVVQEACEVELKGTFKANINNTNEGSCIFTLMDREETFQYMCLDASYTLKGDKCIKNTKIPAKVRYGCTEGYILDGIYCQEK